MTLTHSPAAATRLSAGPGGDAATPPVRPTRQDDPDLRRRVVVTGLAMVSALALSFAGFVVAVSPVQEHRAQLVSYVRLRNALALGTQPVAAPIPAGTPVALLQIPSLGLSEVVAEGTDGATLMAGPGHLRTSVLPGQAGTSVLFGRRAAFGAPFRAIATLRVGAEILTTTGQGVARYLVTDTGSAAVPPRARLAAAATAGYLVLVTAGGRSYLPAGVVRVDATLQPGPPAAPGVTPTAPFPGVPPLGAVGPAESVLAGDTAATVPLALWSQLLLVIMVALSVAWTRFGRATTWLVGAPVVLAVGWHVAEAACRLLPNLL